MTGTGGAPDAFRKGANANIAAVDIVTTAIVILKFLKGLASLCNHYFLSLNTTVINYIAFPTIINTTSLCYPGTDIMTGMRPF
jgi:hypothetical protein